MSTSYLPPSARTSPERAISGPALLAPLLCALAFPALANANAVDTPANGPLNVDVTGSISAVQQHEIRISPRPGQTSRLLLGARLEADGDLISKPVAWKIRASDGTTAFDGNDPVANMALPEGEYDVTVRYGTVHLMQHVSLPPQVQLSIILTLNVGGIRALPRIPDFAVEGAVPGVRSEISVIALDGAEKGQEVAREAQAGAIMRVAAGAYRVETRMIPGNSVASADIIVSPGRMNSINVFHAAGMAELTTSAAPNSVPVWEVHDSHGIALPGLAGTQANLVLSPGTYDISLRTGEKLKTASITVKTGEISRLSLEP